MTNTKNKTPFLDAVANAHYESECITSKLQKLLTDRGWKYSCKTPGAYWLYEKTLPDGRTVLCDQEFALRFEQELCGEEYLDTD